MPWYPNVKKEPLSWAFPTRHKKDKVILHTSVGGIGPALGEWTKKKKLWSTFYVELNGTVTQFCDSGWHAQANGDASGPAISIETEDHRYPTTQWDPWSKAQIDALVSIIRWCSEQHGIPLVRCPSVNGAGIGFHSMFGSSAWNKHAHECPAGARIAQFNWVIMPAVTRVAAKVKVDPEMGGYRGTELWTEVARMRALLGDGVWLEDIMRSKTNNPRAAVPAPGSSRVVRVGVPKKKIVAKAKSVRASRTRTTRTTRGTQLKRAGRRPRP